MPAAGAMAPATETMQPIFKGHPLEAEEIHALAAYFESGAQHNEVEPSLSRVAFLLSGLAMATAAIFVLDVIWKERFQSVRRALVEASSQRSKS